jgi:hypothetical protein
MTLCIHTHTYFVGIYTYRSIENNCDIRVFKRLCINLLYINYFTIGYGTILVVLVLEFGTGISLETETVVYGSKPWMDNAKFAFV